MSVTRPLSVLRTLRESGKQQLAGRGCSDSSWSGALAMLTANQLLCSCEEMKDRSARVKDVGRAVARKLTRLPIWPACCSSVRLACARR